MGRPGAGPDGGHLSLRGAQLTGARFALHAPEFRTGSQVYLTDLRASGTVKRDGARTSDNLRCDGARLTSTTDAALMAVDLQVDDNLLLSNGFQATTGSTTVAAVRIRGARVGGQLALRDAMAPDTVALDLKQVRAGMEILFAPHFPGGPVDLTYVGVPQDATLTDWVDPPANRTSRCASRPYLHVPAAHQAAGSERDVLRIRVAHQQDLLRRGRLTPWGRLWHRTTDATVGYGYGYRPAPAGRHPDHR